MSTLPQTLTAAFTRATLPTRIQLCRSGGVFGKDIIRLSLLLTGFILVGVIGILLYPLTVRLRNQAPLVVEQWNVYAPLVFKLLILTVGYLMAILMHYDEHSFGYTSLPVGLPIRRSTLVIQRIVAIFLATLAWMLIVSSLVWLLAPLVGAPRTWLLGSLNVNMTDSLGLMRSPGETLIQISAAVLMGMAIGSYFRELLVAALGGPFLFIGSIATAAALAESNLARSNIFNTMLFLSIPLSLGLIVRGEKRIFERPTEVAETGESSHQGQSFTRPSRWRTPLFKSANIAIAANLAYAVLVVLIPVLARDSNSSFMRGDFIAFSGYLAAVLSVTLGVCWLTNAERSATSFLLYQLPISRNAFLWKRLLPILSVPLLTGTAFCALLTFNENHPEPKFFSTILSLTVATAVGALMRLFFGSRLIAVVIALAIFSVLVGSGAGVAAAVVSTGYFPNMAPTYVLATSAIILLLTILFIWVTYCRTRLLEQSGSIQGMLGMCVTVVFLFLSALIIFSPVTDLYQYIKLSSGSTN